MWRRPAVSLALSPPTDDASSKARAGRARKQARVWVVYKAAAARQLLQAPCTDAFSACRAATTLRDFSDCWHRILGTHVAQSAHATSCCIDPPAHHARQAKHACPHHCRDTVICCIQPVQQIGARVVLGAGHAARFGLRRLPSVSPDAASRNCASAAAPGSPRRSAHHEAVRRLLSTISSSLFASPLSGGRKLDTAAILWAETAPGNKDGTAATCCG